MEPYSHTPLLLPRSIRLLILEPATSLNAPLKCSLREEDLDIALPYQALSYVWGARDPATEEPLHVQTVSGSYRLLAIWRNCATALRHLRFTKEVRTMWIDAICIDQNSTTEKNQQVPLMQTIYKQASRVLVWLDVSALGPSKVKLVLRYFNRQRSLFASNYMRMDSDEEYKKSKVITRLLERYSRLKGALLEGMFIGLAI
jgi:Heterokaryon incompatibility protein (HET)